MCGYLGFVKKRDFFLLQERKGGEKKREEEERVSRQTKKTELSKKKGQSTANLKLKSILLREGKNIVIKKRE